MVFNVTFNNISVISWRSVLLVEETTDLSQVTDKLYHIMLYTSPWSRFKLTTSVVIGTDCIGSCKSNYHTITATTDPFFWRRVKNDNLVLSFTYHISLCTSVLFFLTNIRVIYRLSWTSNKRVENHMVLTHNTCQDFKTN